MRCFDVFNGDADGLCALRQLRLARPVRASLVTGLKREIELLRRVKAGPGDRVTVLDVSLDRNRQALDALLEAGAEVLWFDHHEAGVVPAHPRLVAVIDERGDCCTSILVDRHLQGEHRAWAVVGAFGDGMAEEALELAQGLDVDARALGRLRDLGESLNYNACGERESDVLVPPRTLYRILARYADPLEAARAEPVIARLHREREDDLARARTVPAARATAASAAWILPDEPWSRRVAGTFAHRLAQSDPDRAHAVLVPTTGGYRVSVRVPRRAAGPTAAAFCRRFPSGGGRARAGGIDRLAPARLAAFHAAFEAAWAPAAAPAV